MVDTHASMVIIYRYQKGDRNAPSTSQAIALPTFIMSIINMTYASELEQISRQAEDAAIEAFFLDGVHDGFEGNKPQYSEIIYLQGYCQGMKNFEAQSKHIVFLLEREMAIATEVAELPLVCGQCAHLINGKCAIKNIDRDSSKYACDRIVVDCPF